MRGAFIKILILLAVAVWAGVPNGCGGKTGEAAKVGQKGGADGKSAGPAAGKAGADGKRADREEPAALGDEFRMVRSELELARAETPYLVLDFPGKKLVLKRNGTVLWDSPIVFEPGSGEKVRAFIEAFKGSQRRFARPVEGGRLYTFTEQSPDSVLKIVSEVVRAKTELMQRIIPGRFEVSWRGGCYLEVVTGVDGKRASRIPGLLLGIGRWLGNRGGGERLVIRIEPEKSITLYRVATKDFPTLLITD